MKKNLMILPALLATTMLAGCVQSEKPHEHTFSDVWSKNETNHWHEASCEHTDFVKDLKTHNFDGGNTCIDCGFVKETPTPVHEHTFGNEWSKDDTNHWHTATCEHTDLTKDLAEHNFGDDDTCDVCGYTKPAPAHEHTFSDVWSKDETNHWHASTCEHTDLTKDLAEHNFGVDDICDDCGYTKPAPAHEHTFSEDWSKDETNHWHAATCEHTDLTKDLAEHNFGDDDTCDVCGYTKPTPVHVHTFSSDWSMDANKHWQDSTCNHTVVDNLGDHTYGNDNLCTICGFKKIEKHTITYVGWPDDIENPNPTEFIRTDNFVLDGSPIEAKEGLINAKFFVNSVQVTTLTGIDEDVTVSVTYDASTTTITFDPNNGVDESATVDVTYWSIPSELIDEYTRENHSLLGWFKDNGDEVDINEHWIGTETTLNLTAKWKFDGIDQYIKNVEDFEKDLIVQLGQLAPMGDLFPTAVRDLDGLLDLARKELLIKDYTKEEADSVYKKHTAALNTSAVSHCQGPLSVALTAAFNKRKDELAVINASRIPYLETVYYSYLGFANPEKPLKEVIQSWRAAMTTIETFF